MKIKRRECGSASKGKLAKGCELCTEGAKMVLFVTGQCDTGCVYCPISSEKKNSDLMFANESLVSGIDGIIEEAELMDAAGTGITGGDPLLVLDRTVRMIRSLKERFGNDHHIHLYTSTIDSEKATALKNAGLDEIRFHPPADVWENIAGTELSKIIDIAGLDVGLEIPALPDRASELAKLVKDASKLGVDFINLNELEFSETNWDMMNTFGYDLKDETSSAVSGSEELALNVMSISEVPIHFCSSSFKDSVQLRKRLIRRAENIARKMDIVTEDGTILKGILYADDIDGAIRSLREKYEVPDELMFFDPAKKRLEVAPWVLEELAEEIPFKCYIVEEYPTSDRLEVERTPLN